MAFECPSCSGNSLKITSSLELPPGHFDETAVQTVECGACHFRGIAVYVESRRGGGENFHHYGYEISDEDMERVLSAVKLCPAPPSPRCNCQTHLLWGKYSWITPKEAGITVKKQFSMRIVD